MQHNSGVFDLQKLAVFTNELRSEAFLHFLQSRINYDIREIQKPYFNYIEEAEFSVRALSELDLTNKTILEIGSGAGILTAWLLLNKLDIRGIEPSALGFHFQEDIFSAVLDHFNLPPNRIFDMTAEELTPEKLGKFHIIFSINVMEHVPVKNLELVFSRMKSVMLDDGIMYHHCPNYIVPFEPHYGIPLIPFFPQITGRLKKVAQEDLWKSVNFLTLPRMKSIARKLDLKIQFRKKVLQETFARLETDKEFAARHSSLVTVYKGMKATGVIYLLGLIPPVLCTPMSFILSSKDNPIQFSNR